MRAKTLLQNFSIVAIVGLLSACAKPETWTREQAEAVTTRSYSGVSQAELLSAAEEALRRSDPKNMEFAYSTDGFTARRARFLYLVITAMDLDYRFVFETERRDGQILTRLNVYNATSSITPTPVFTPGATNVGWAATANSAGATAWQDEGIYQLFYERLDYALDRRETWPECPRGSAYEPLCLGAG